jgi:hypothetical protein
MAKDYGFIRADPLTGEWHWPFSKMEEGDTFCVAAADREPRKVCSMVRSRGYQLNRRFSTSTAADGTVTVYRGPAHRLALHEPVQMKFNHFIVLLFKLTGNADPEIPWEMATEFQQPVFVPMKMREAHEGNRRLIVYVNPQLFGIEIREDGVMATPIDENTTPQAWAAQALLED